MIKKRDATLIRLPKKISSAEVTKPTEFNSDEFNPMRAALLFAEVSKVIGPKKTVAQVYDEIMNFDANEYLRTLKQSRA